MHQAISGPRARSKAALDPPDRQLRILAHSTAAAHRGPGARMLVFYTLQGEEGEDLRHPNAFEVSPAGESVVLADVLRCFPLSFSSLIKSNKLGYFKNVPIQ